MRQHIWLAQHHIPATLSYAGLSILLTGIAHRDQASIRAISPTLIQKGAAFKPTSVTLRTGLLLPKLAAKIPKSFVTSLGNGFSLSATFPFDSTLSAGLACVEVSVSWTDGLTETLRMATVFLEQVMPCSFDDVPIGPNTVGIALATYNPDLFLFRRQIRSIRDQTHSDWICVISDDCSSPGILRELRTTIAEDPRFVLTAATSNAGFYRNFERALAGLPRQCCWIAFSDQDDEWEPEKLAVLLREAHRSLSPIVFSDMRVFSASGQKLADTFWTYRRCESDNAIAIALANTVTGMAMLARSSVLSTALPFPALPGVSYHDRWIALAALAQGKLHYVEQPLVRYVQHAGNHTGVLKRHEGGLIYQFLRCVAGCGIAVICRSRRATLLRQLEPCARWTAEESLSLELQLEALQQRLRREAWRPQVWDQFRKLKTKPAAALWNLSLKSLADPYRRHILTGLALGSLFYFALSIVLKFARTVSNARQFKAL
jgi:hypothetical protein